MNESDGSKTDDETAERDIIEDVVDAITRYVLLMYYNALKTNDLLIHEEHSFSALLDKGIEQSLFSSENDFTEKQLSDIMFNVDGNLLFYRAGYLVQQDFEILPLDQVTLRLGIAPDKEEIIVPLSPTLLRNLKPNPLKGKEDGNKI